MPGTAKLIGNERVKTIHTTVKTAKKMDKEI